MTGNVPRPVFTIVIGRVAVAPALNGGVWDGSVYWAL